MSRAPTSARWPMTCAIASPSRAWRNWKRQWSLTTSGTTRRSPSTRPASIRTIATRTRSPSSIPCWWAASGSRSAPRRAKSPPFSKPGSPPPAFCRSCGCPAPGERVFPYSNPFPLSVHSALRVQNAEQFPGRPAQRRAQVGGLRMPVHQRKQGQQRVGDLPVQQPRRSHFNRGPARAR